MQATWTRALAQAAALTFEELCFVVAEPQPPTAQGDVRADMAVAVAFSGPFAGVLVVQLEQALLEVLAANMLGDEAPPSAAQQEDALKEIANVICGNVLPRLAGAEQVFRLQAPRRVSVALPGAGVAEVVLWIEGWPVQVQLYAEVPAAVEEPSP
ncbi:MAG: hypothetical protein KatS3mg131_1246 [Candidatus Tectimicrobiota bacterium]|nr:MAG: hypothetical protein KatS3mg131_1246 [Candidatus Tectomicrobia bacterium]